FFQRTAEAAHAVAILPDILALGFVEDVANVGARESIRLNERDEILDQILEEDIVLPERVVGVDEQSVAAHYNLSSQKDLNLTNLSLTASAHLPRFPRRHLAGRVCAPLLSCERSAADRQAGQRFSTRLQANCCSESPRLLRADGRRCALPGRGWVQ